MRPSITHLVHPTITRRNVPMVTRMNQAATTHNVTVIIRLANLMS